MTSPGPRTTPLERLAIERIGDGRAAALKVRRLVRRPCSRLLLHGRGGCAQKRGRSLELSGLNGDSRTSIATLSRISDKRAAYPIAMVTRLAWPGRMWVQMSDHQERGRA
jgi:hypothetical protein